MARGIILSIGSVNQDIQVRTDRWPEPGETRLVHDLLITGGGKGANVAYLARKLGAPSCLVARVGQDDAAELALQGLRDMGVDLTHVRGLPDQRTGLALIAVRADGDKSILLAENANGAWEQDGREEAARVVREAPEGSVVAIDLEVSPEVVRRVLQAAHARGLQVVLDPSPADRFEQGYARLADFVTPNPAEAAPLVGFPVRDLDDAFRAGDALRERGVAHVLVKMGAQGCAVVSDELREHVPAPPVDVVDTTGGGDAFAGGLAFALWEQQPLDRAVRFAVAASALAVTGYGSQPAYPDREAVDRMLVSRK